MTDQPTPGQRVEHRAHRRLGEEGPLGTVFAVTSDADGRANITVRFDSPTHGTVDGFTARDLRVIEDAPALISEDNHTEAQANLVAAATVVLARFGQESGGDARHWDKLRHALELAPQPQPIEYYQRSNFGNAPRIYIEDAQTAADLERLTGRRTHTLQDLQILTSIGAQFVEIADPRNKSCFADILHQERTSR
tara:strand:- start:2335 stop:2916 length:582 start_codon:yes stop_codon:yes gene_type:complete